jgi:aspartyl-tRNA synthetase
MVSPESVVDVTGVVSAAKVDSATQSTAELQMSSFHCVVKAAPLPFTMEDACRPDADEEAAVGEYTGEEATSSDGLVRVGQEMRLDYRWLDLRTPANQSIFRIESMTTCLFREVLLKQDFVEIHTPKIIGGASEGGSDVFQLDYFGSPACLAMSPQVRAPRAGGWASGRASGGASRSARGRASGRAS